ncbi:MAG: alpha-1,2-fucosyltransferase [Chitinophagales bacterium]
MIIVQLRGGLGNQMFQYAFGRYLSLKRNTTLVLDTSFLQSKLPIKRLATQMQYELHIFNVQAALKTNLFSSNMLLYPLAKAEYMIREKINSRRYQLVRETDFPFHPEFLHIDDNSYLIGNFQSEQYFKQVEQDIRKDFSFNHEMDHENLQWKNKIEQCNAVSLHVRRGDYLSIAKNAQKFAAVPLSYYQQAVKLIGNQMPDAQFFIFSDDIGWVKENLKIDAKVHFVQNNHTKAAAYMDMRLMSLCRHNIIANSTFSWWAGWLNGYPDKIVISPAKWFEDSSINSKDIYPSEWIKL